MSDSHLPCIPLWNSVTRRGKRVRRVVRGDVVRFEARPWVGDELLGSVNLGQHPTEAAARQAISIWVRAGCRPDAGLPPGVLPRWVWAEPGGTFEARLRYAGRMIRERQCDSGERVQGGR